MANKAYMRFLRETAKQYDRPDEAERFLDWLESTQPDEYLTEPDLYAYGDANGQYAYGYVDATSLEDYECVPVDPVDRPRVLAAWADRINQRLVDPDCRIIRDTMPDQYHPADRDA